MIYFLFIINFIEIVAAVLASAYYKKYNKTTEKYFIYFLWYTVFIETIGAITGHIFEINYVEIYIFYDIVSFLFFIFWYYSILTNTSNKKIISISAIIFICIALFELLNQDWKSTSNYTSISGAIITIIGSSFYFSEILKSNIILKIKQNLRFWIATGLLLFNVGYVPVQIFNVTFNAHSGVKIIILICLNVILYTCYSLGFIWTKKEES